MVRVERISDFDLGPLIDAGYRERPEEWNRVVPHSGLLRPCAVWCALAVGEGPVYPSLTHNTGAGDGYRALRPRGSPAFSGR
jgi:hypothetical protein